MFVLSYSQINQKIDGILVMMKMLIHQNIGQCFIQDSFPSCIFISLLDIN